MPSSRIPSPVPALPLLAAALLALAPGCGKDDAPATPPAKTTASGGGTKPSGPDAASSSVPKDPTFGAPLVVNGTSVPKEALRTYLVHSEVGLPYLETKKLEILVDQEIQRRRAEGEEVSGYVADPGQVDEAFEQAEADLAKEYPGQNFSLEEASPIKDLDLVRRNLELNQLFDKLFLPENPYEYPPITVAALNIAAKSELMVEQLRQGWDERQAAGEEEMPKDEQGQQFLNSLLRSMVLDHITATADIQYPGDGIPTEVALRVNGVDIPSQAIWAYISDQVAPIDVYRAKQWFVNTTLATEALKKSGEWLNDEEFQQLYKDEHEPYIDSPFSLERVAINFRKFPSINAYRTYYRIYNSYKRMIKDEITDDALKTRVDRLDLLIAGKIDADVILISAYDFRKREWKPDGWRKAEERAIDVVKKLAEGLSWDEALTTYSEFYDPPIPESQKAEAANLPRKNQGRFVQVGRNELMGFIQESEFQAFLDTASVTDFVFYEQEMGTTNNPLRGPYGYYIPKLHKRQLGARTIDLNSENHRTLLEQDLVIARLNRYIYDLRAAADIQGLDFY